MFKRNALTKCVLAGCCMSSFISLKSRINLTGNKSCGPVWHQPLAKKVAYVTRTNLDSIDLSSSVGHLIAKRRQSDSCHYRKSFYRVFEVLHYIRDWALNIAAVSMLFWICFISLNVLSRALDFESVPHIQRSNKFLV